MKETVKLNIEEGLSFDIEINGLNMKIDSNEEVGGKNRGPRPKSLMLAALGGCTGMDVASIMRKMKVPFEDLSIEVTGEITEDHPKHFKKMHITYIISGKGVDRKKAEKAVSLSQEKYCGVTYNYKASMEITHEIIIKE